MHPCWRIIKLKHVGNAHNQFCAANLLCVMSSADAFSTSVGEYMLAFGALFLKIEIWTHGENL